MSGIDVTVLDAMNWLIIVISVTIVWLIMREFSMRIGEALHMRRYYRLYDLGEALIALSVLLFMAHYALNYEVFVGGTNIIPLAPKVIVLTALVIDVAVSVRYWGWIVPEVLALRKK